VRKRLGLILVILAGLVGTCSLLSRPNPSLRAGDPWLQGAHIEPAVLAVLHRSCGDCHSEDTYYPWYSYVAPVSWLINSDVEGGRRHLNFSQWGGYPLVRKERSLSEIANQVKDGDMPLVQYTLIHHNAKLSSSDIAAVFAWTQQERARLIAESAR